MRAAVASGVLAAAALVAPPADACINATMQPAESVSKLREAEAALEEGDVETARELAHAVREGNTESDLSAVYEHALWVEALATVRDPRARAPELEEAVERLDAWVEERALATTRESERAHEASPRVVAAAGESLERIRRDEEAIRRLQPLADRDLLGSPYAWAALSRASSRRGLADRALAARIRCETITSRAGICRGEYPSPPLLRGKPLAYALPGLVFLGAALHRLRRHARRAVAPWSKYGERLFALLVLLAGATIVLLFQRSVVLGTAAAVLAVLGAQFGQRQAFLHAVRRGEVAGYRLRSPEPVDAAVPLVPLLFGPEPPETLETGAPDAPEAMYREPARVPVVRVGRRRFSRRREGPCDIR